MAFVSVGNPRQYKQPSRKGKKAWRKNVDITEVEDGLESLREEIIQGGPVSEKPSDELFARDTTREENPRSIQKPRKVLKVDQILGHRSAVSAFDSRKRPHSRTTDGIVEESSKNRKLDWVSRKEVQRVKNAIQSQSLLTTKRLEDDDSVGFDLWESNLNADTAKSEQNQYIPKARARVAPSTLRRAPVAMTANGKHVRAVKTPDAGASYNPAFDDWENLLSIEGQRAIAAEQHRLEEEKSELDRQTRIAASGADEERVAQTDDDSAWEGFESNADEPGGPNRKQPKRKTPAQRNRINRRKAAEKLVKQNTARGDRKDQQKQVESAALILHSLGQSESLIQQDSTENSDDGDDTFLRRRKLGNTTILDKPLEFVLPDELQDSLRRLKPEGNLLNDRYRNLLVNGKIESRKPILQPKKKKRTFTEKWSYKDFSIKV